jgi:hypothetical protein
LRFLDHPVSSGENGLGHIRLNRAREIFPIRLNGKHDAAAFAVATAALTAIVTPLTNRNSVPIAPTAPPSPSFPRTRESRNLPSGAERAANQNLPKLALQCPVRPICALNGRRKYDTIKP